jgi:hypothetical protein
MGTYVQGTVVAMDRASATLASGQQLGFDYAAICTGSSYSNTANKGSATSMSERLEEIKVRPRPGQGQAQGHGCSGDARHAAAAALACCLGRPPGE